MKLAARFLILMVCCAPGFAIAQDNSDPFGAQAEPDINTLLRALQNRLEAGKDVDPFDKRATRIGSTRRVTPVTESMVVRIYDASDLFVVAPSYIARHDSDIADARDPLFPVASAFGPSGTGLSGGGGFGGGGFGGGGFGGGGFGGGGMGGAFNVESKVKQIKPPNVKTLHQFGQAMAAIDMRAARVTLDDLVNAITTTIAPDTWSEAGGEGSVSKLGSSLLISQTESVHEQISSLMNLFRERWGSLRTVSVIADWVWLREAELNELLEKNGEAFGLVDVDRWLQFRAAPPAAGARSGYSAAITCQNGQTVHTLAGGQMLAVTNLIPVVGGAEKSVGYQPSISMIQEGAALQVTPISNRSGKFVTLDVHSRVTLVKGWHREQQEEPKEVNAIVAAIDRPQVATQRLSTTLRAPVGHAMLVGGMTFEGQPQADDPNLYLFVTVAIQELRDDIEDAKAEEEPAKAAAEG